MTADRLVSHQQSTPMGTSSTRSLIRLGAIDFINTLPIYDRLELPPQVSLQYGTPSFLNGAMKEGSLDISPVSSAFYLAHQEDFVLLSDLSVSSPGGVESVVFASNTPLEALQPQQVIPVPDSSATSIALLGHLLQVQTGMDFRPQFMTFAAKDYLSVLETYGCALIIGDDALKLTNDGSLSPHFYVYDLATLWTQTTELPFVFAVWIAQRQWAEEHPDQLLHINHLLCQNRDRFFEHPERRESTISLAQSQCKIETEVLHRYFTRCLDYHLQSPHHEALFQFGQLLYLNPTPPKTFPLPQAAAEQHNTETRYDPALQ